VSPPAIRRTLRQAALGMTTLHYDEAALDRAVDAFPAVESVSAEADLPNVHTEATMLDAARRVVELAG